MFSIMRDALPRVLRTGTILVGLPSLGLANMREHTAQDLMLLPTELHAHGRYPDSA